MAAWQRAESESDSDHLIVSASDDLPSELNANASMWKSDASGRTYQGDDSAYESEATSSKAAETETLDEISMKKLLSKLKRSATATLSVIMFIVVIHAESHACYCVNLSHYYTGAVKLPLKLHSYHRCVKLHNKLASCIMP